MRSVRLHGVRDLRVEEIAPPVAPGPGEATLRVLAAGICGSDLHNYVTGAWISRAPSVAGHEFCGVVTAVGAGVTQVAPGDTVAVDSRVTCGKCAACRAGLAQVCAQLGFLGEVIDGGFAESVTLPARNLLRADPAIPPAHLAMAEPLAVALHAVHRLAAPAGAPVVVTGAGAIGALSALLLVRAGHPVLLAERNTPRRARIARATGTQELESLTAQAVAGARHALEATGSPAVLEALLQGLQPGGSIALVGIGGGKLPLSPAMLVEREVALIGCHAFADELAAAVALLPALGPALEVLIDARIPLEEVPAAYGRHLEGAVSGAKTIILPAGAA